MPSARLPLVARIPARYPVTTMNLSRTALLSAALALSAAACKPPEPVTLPAREDAPPNGRALMGGRPAEGKGAGGMPDFARAIAVKVAWDATAQKVVANVELQPGFHAYGPGDATGRPLAFELTTPGFALQDVVVPAGVDKNLGDLGISKVVTGNVTASARVVPSAQNAGVAEGKFHYQVCSDTACDRPRSVPFRAGG